MLEVLTGFIRELREAGVPASMVESIDAVRALSAIDMSDRAAFKSALAATLVKNEGHYEAFDVAFETFFASGAPRPGAEDDPQSPDSPGPPPSGPGGGGGEGDAHRLREALAAALEAGDEERMRRLARLAVEALAGMERGRPVGGAYYLYRTLRRLSADEILEELAAGWEERGLERAVRRDEMEARLEFFRRRVRDEIRRRLVADRGREAVARTLRVPLVEDLDLMHATRVDLARISKAVYPLTRKLASRLAARRKRLRAGRLDFRRTLRRSLQAGGTPIDPVFRKPSVTRPEIILLCDVSGSMATFARFTLQFVYAMSGQFGRLRSFVFVDALDEATRFFAGGIDFETALAAVTTEAEVVWLDGHSDYGNSLEMFRDRYGADVTARTTVIVTGDARNNYRRPRAEVLAQVRERARALYWLNPEPRPYWNTGDSVMDDYARFCDGVFEVRNLRQLRDFIEMVGVQQPAAPARAAVG